MFLIILIIAAVVEFTGSKKASAAFDAMSTTTTVQLEGRDAEKAAAEIRSESQRIEDLLSMYVEGSDIYNINNGNGYVAVSPETALLLERCGDFSEESSGIFDVTIGRLTQLWGICSDNPTVPSDKEIADALAAAGQTDRLRNTEKAGITCIETDGSLCIDLGGVAKGYALDCFRNILDNNRISKGIISIGGNVLVYGDNNGKQYSVGLRTPVKYDSGYFCAISLSDTVVSTTGGYERFFTASDGTVYNHVLDPRTGYPTDNGLLSVSVICPDATRADYLSTRLFILGEDEAAVLFDELAKEGIYVVMVNDRNVVRCSRELEKIMPVEKRSKEHTFIFE